MLRIDFRLPALLILSVASSAGVGQTSESAKGFLLARATYYTPTTDGLRTFDCHVSTNWHELLSQASGGKDIADANPLLQYLNTVNLTLHNSLHGSAEVRWSESTPIPDKMQDAVAKMKGGIAQMLEGYFQSWNAYLNGAMVPFPDKSTVISSTQDGMHLSAAGAGMNMDEDYDRNMLLTRAHVATNESDTVALPKFTDTPKGRVISEVKSEVRQPPTAPPVYITLAATYQTIDRYEIPSTLHFEVRNLLRMDFNLTNCTVNELVPNKPAQ